MALQYIADLLKEGRSQFCSMLAPVLEKVPALKVVSDYTHENPWISLGIVLGTYVLYKVITYPRDLPPGPSNLPWIGALSMMRKDMGEHLHEKRSEYGDIVYFRLFGENLIILNSEETMRECLVGMPDDFATRKKYNYFEMMLGDAKDEIFNAPFGPEWKEHKKFAVQGLKSFGFGSPKSEDKIHTGCDKLEAILLEKKGSYIEPLETIRLALLSTVVDVVFNEPFDLEEPELKERLQITGEWMEHLIKTDYMALFDGSKFLLRLLFSKEINKGLRLTRRVRTITMKMIEQHRKEGIPDEPRDMVDYYLKERASDPDLTDQVIADTLYVFFIDGSYTAGQLVLWTMYFFAKYPDMQKRVQKQIDEVVGQQMKPSLSHKPQLPYVEAFFYESMRFCNFLPLSLPRELTKDISYKGYRLPKHSMIMGNIYAINNDPKIFPYPDKFDPMRYITPDGKIDNKKSSSVIVFGLGRRSCPGEMYMRSKIYLALTRLMQRFTVSFDPEFQVPDSNHAQSATTFGLPPTDKFCFTER